MVIIRARPLAHFHNERVKIGFLDRLFLRKDRTKPDLNQQMFKEDFSRIFHYSNRRSGDLFHIATNDSALTERLLARVDTRSGSHSVDEIIREWTEEIANTLIFSGKAYFYFWEDSASDDFKIISFGPNGVTTFLNMTFQWVPRRAVLHWNRDTEERPREVRFLDRLRILHFKMPKMLRRMLRAQNKVLSVIDRHQYSLTNFYPEVTHQNPNPKTHFDFGAWRDAQDLALYRSTRGTGWNGRKYDGTKRSDFFECHRRIRFRRNQIILRDDILKQLGSELTSLGKQFNPKYDLTIKPTNRLPSLRQLNELEKRLSDENAAFSEVIDVCLKS